MSTWPRWIPSDHLTNFSNLVTALPKRHRFLDFTPLSFLTMPLSLEHKPWCDREFERLKAFVGEGKELEVQSKNFSEIVRSFTEDLERHANRLFEERIAAGDSEGAWSFLEALHHMHQKFNFGSYLAMAREMSNYMIGVAEARSTAATFQYVGPPLPSMSPHSGPPTPCTIDGWMNDVDTHLDKQPLKSSRRIETPTDANSCRNQDRSPVQHDNSADESVAFENVPPLPSDEPRHGVSDQRRKDKQSNKNKSNASRHTDVKSQSKHRCSSIEHEADLVFSRQRYKS